VDRVLQDPPERVHEENEEQTHYRYRDGQPYIEAQLFPRGRSRLIDDVAQCHIDHLPLSDKEATCALSTRRLRVPSRVNTLIFLVFTPRVSCVPSGIKRLFRFQSAWRGVFSAW